MNFFVKIIQKMLTIIFSLFVTYNKYIGDCYAILDKYEYDLTKFIDKDPYYSISDYYSYVIRLCRSRISAENSDAFLLQCPKGTFTSNCREIIGQNSLNFKPRNPQNFSEGVIYFAESEPFTEDGVNYKTIDLEFDLICDQNEKSDTIDFAYTFKDDTDIGQIKLRGRTSSACPSIVASPTPTPVYEPDCKYTDRKDDETAVGIDGDLSLLNDGPYGVKTAITVGEKNMTLFYQACERMLCPPTFSCEKSGYSSAWLCDNEVKKCVSYGVGQSDIDLRPVDSSLANGMLYRMSDNDHSIEMTFTCSNSFPEGHILWSNLGVLNGNNLSVGGKTKEFCLKVIPTPSPPPEDGCCVFNATIDNEAISIDLENYNVVDKGWSTKVSVDSDSSKQFPESTLIFQPCGGVICPPDTYCDGDEDAQVWLCYEENKQKECTGYGLTKYNVSIKLADQTRLSNGLVLSYTGDNRRFADVSVYCDPSLPQNQLYLPSYVTLTGRRLSFYVSASGACPFDLGPSPSPSPWPIPSPTQTPIPVPWYPKKPKKPSDPTPTPNPSVSPNFFVFNDTHYTEINLNSLTQQFFEGNVIVTNHKNTANLLMNWHPWILSDCPTGFSCDDFELANLWMCWNTGYNYCHPVADKRIGVEMRLTKEGTDEMTNGVVIDYEGGYGFDTKLNVKCNIFETESIKFDDGADFTYYDDNNGRLTIALDSKLACAKEFVKPTIPPTPLPTPTVNPSAKVDRNFVSSEINGQIIKLNLNDLDSISETVFIKMKTSESSDKVYRSFVLFSPSGVVDCPTGFNCLSKEKSTLWNCYNSSTKENVCVPIGDDRVNLEFYIISRIEDSSAFGPTPIGISVKYSGGYDQIETNVEFLCNSNSSEIKFDSTAEQIENSFTFKIETSVVCPVKSSHKVKVTGGSVFLFIVVAVSSLYLSIGVLVEFIRNGNISLPNSEIWSEFGACVLTAINFFFSCGKKNVFFNNSSKYDVIN